MDGDMAGLNAKETGAARGTIRPLMPSRDLRTVVELVADAFADEMDERALAALRDMRWLARLSPLVWWLERADPTFSDWFGGFVWEEDGQIVGNVSLQRAPGRRRGWVVCNVVVDKAYRGRGIGRQLTQVAIEEAHLRGGEAILLQVRADNVVARTLYEDLGFRAEGGEAIWYQPEVRAVAWQPVPGIRLSRWDAKTGRLATALARQAVPAAQQWLRPVRRKDYEYGWLERIANWISGLLTGRRTLRLAAWKDAPQGEARLVAVMQLCLNVRGGEHQTQVMIHPEERGKGLEEMLVGHVLEVLSDLPRGGLAVTYEAVLQELSHLLADWGFVERSTLLTMQYAPLNH
jgi:ribosomal protein S18 acetylase RimI-like enzyme